MISDLVLNVTQCLNIADFVLINDIQAPANIFLTQSICGEDKVPVTGMPINSYSKILYLFHDYTDLDPLTLSCAKIRTDLSPCCYYCYHHCH